MKKKIVISGINLYQGGPLAIYTDLLEELVQQNKYEEYDFTLFVHRKELFSKYINYFDIIELPKSRNSWIYRVYYEYYYFSKYSKTKNIFLWISLHDITPNVKVKNLVTYCHNSSPFYNSSLHDFQYDKKFYLFSKFYKYLYRINIHSNTFLIVQQQWIREEFKKMYHIDNIILYPPTVHIDYKESLNDSNDRKTVTFFYPSLPRVFKNFEVICEAVKYLSNHYEYNFEVILTIDGSENKYSKYIFKTYNNLKNIKFIGQIPREKVFEIYNYCDVLLFPSQLETWGLPITEFKNTGKPIFLSDFQYAHETLGDYNKAIFFEKNDYISLAKYMDKYIKKQISYQTIRYIKNKNNIVCSWSEVIKLFESNNWEES